MHRLFRRSLPLLSLLILALPAAGAAKSPAVPSTIEFQGTKYVNCKPDPQYPFAVDRKIEKIRGRVGEEFGSKSLPWRAATVNGMALFNPVTKGLIGNYDPLLGKHVAVEGYAGTGRVGVVYFLDKTEKQVDFPKAFYVRKIQGWLHVYGYAVAADPGKTSATPTYFWIREK